MRSNEHKPGEYFEIPAWSSVVPAIARVSFTEILRDKVLYNVLLFGLILFASGFLASRLTFVRPERVVLDFGMSAVSLACTVMAVLFGAGIIGREFERRTVHVVLSKPISRAQFLYGKFAGLGMVIFLNWLLLAASYVVILCFMQGAGATFGNVTLYPALLFALMQALLMAAVTIFLASFTTTTLAVMMSIGLFLIGENITTLRALVAPMEGGPFKIAVSAIISIFPNLELFVVGTRLTYALSLGFGRVFYSLGYGILCTGVFLFAASLSIRRKEV